MLLVRYPASRIKLQVGALRLAETRARPYRMHVIRRAAVPALAFSNSVIRGAQSEQGFITCQMTRS